MDREEGEGEKERGGGGRWLKVRSRKGRRRMEERRKDWRRGAHGLVLTGWPVADHWLTSGQEHCTYGDDDLHCTAAPLDGRLSS